MPHQCTNCGHIFPDGSKEMLSGCPDCGGNKFQFKQGSVADVTDDSDTQSPPSDGSNTPTAADQDATGDTTERPDPATTAEPSTTTDPDSTVDPDSTTDPTSPSDDPTDAELMDSNATETGESPAQSTARSDVVSEDELPDSPPESDSVTTPTATENTAHSTDTQTESSTTDSSGVDSSGIDQLRQELNDQFESIRIVSPGQYELNLMELYDRDEYIISLREDGRYVIEVPDSWDTDTPS
ncbi:MAG: Zn-ribbon containing protein (DUF2072) [Halonotius sp. J07HN4]|nr:MAG: Zn-ribbon containing protein (DUF2072) [Halonotius sp. J07HN4]